MWNTGSTYNLSSGMAVAGEWVPMWVGWVAEPLTGHTYQCFRDKAGSSGPTYRTLFPPLISPSLGTGMPTAYDLSSVIASGSSVGHNNLIPLGECAWVWGGGGEVAGTQNGPCTQAFCITFSSSLGLLAEVPHSSLPRSAAAAPTHPVPWCESVSGSAHLKQNVGLDWLGAVTPSPFLPSFLCCAANTGIVNHTHSRMGSIMSTGIVQGNRANGSQGCEHADCWATHWPSCLLSLSL